MNEVIICKRDLLSPTQVRLAADVESAVSRFLELFESDDMRLKATQILADMIVTRKEMK